MSKAKPKVLILKADGINRDEELAYAFDISGGAAKIIHINDLRTKKESLQNYQVLALPGGFAYGDDIVSGKILAIELTSFFKEELQKFIARKDTAVIGVCNGFQVLVRTGLLPFAFAQGEPGTMQVTLTNNDSGHFECRWIKARIEKSKCVFLKDIEDIVVTFPVAHGEGKFFANNETIKTIEQSKLVAFRYVDDDGKPTQNYPQNPNGSINAIMGITDPTGRILGLMPHPECFTLVQHHPNWRRMDIKEPQGLLLFKRMVKFVKES